MKQKANITLALLGLTAVLIFLGSLELQQWQKRRTIQKEINHLREQEQETLNKNQSLSDSLGYLTSGEYKERIARQQLNLKRDGELVLGFAAGSETTEATAAENPIDQTSNPRKWWNYFFKNN
jgi:hypothetical protein